MDLPAAEGCREVIKSLEATIEEFQFSRRLIVSDDLKIGFISTDRATQTEESEIVPVKELTSSTRKLVKIVKSLQVDFAFLKQLLQLQFEDRLKEESSRLFSILSERIQLLERALYQNQDVIRMSYNQQLSDAIAVIKAMYKGYFEREEEEKIFEKNTIFLKMTNLLKRLKEKEELIEALKEEMEIYEETAPQRYDSYIRDTLGSLKSILIEKDLGDCKADLEKLTQKVADLQEELTVSIKENSHLEYEIMNLKERAERDKSSIQKLIEGREKLVTELQNEKLLVQGLTVKYKDELETKKKFDSLALKAVSSLEKQHVSGQTSMLKVASKTVLDSLVTLEPTKLPLRVKHLKKSKTLLAKDDRWLRLMAQLADVEGKKVTPDVRTLERQIELLKSNLETEKKKAERYKRESERISKIWEKKFSILRNSLHVLKNEMFTRHTLYRQFAVLADTSFNYAKVKPLYVERSSAMESDSSGSDYRFSTMDIRYNLNNMEPQTRTNSSKASRTTLYSTEKPQNLQRTPKSSKATILKKETRPNPQNTPENSEDVNLEDEGFPNWIPYENSGNV